MKRFTQQLSLSILLLVFLWNHHVNATSIIATDTITYDAWIADTVLVQSNVYVIDTLIINPGVQVIFEGFYRIEFGMNAVLYANGSSASPVYFKPMVGNEGVGWGGLVFNAISYTTSSGLNYCHLYYAKNDSLRSDGGGIYVSDHADLTLQNCTFKNCGAVGLGGAIFINNSSVAIQNCFFTGGLAGNGSAVAIQQSDISLVQNIIANNDGANQIYVYGEGRYLNMVNNTISNNYGAPLYCTGINATLKNNIFSNHSQGITFNSYISSFDCQNNCFFNLPDIINPGLTSSMNYKNNLTVDPGFVLPTSGYGSYEDGTNGNWHLNSSSNLINAGYRDTTGMNLLVWDYDYQGRLYNGTYKRIDMGAYEYQGDPLSPQLVFDVPFNADTTNIGLAGPNSGTPSHTPSYITSRFSSQLAFNFDGTQSVMFSPVAAMQGTNQFTLSAWIRPQSDNLAAEYVLMSSVNFGNEWQLSLKDHKLIFKMWSGGTLQTYETFQEMFYNDAWTLATVVCDGSYVYFYKNNYQYEYLIYTGGTIDDYNSDLTIGSFAGVSNYFVGGIGQVKIYDKAIGADMINSLVNDRGPLYEKRNLYRGVIFYVNMGYYIQQGLFNPMTETVDLAGSFNSWGGNPKQMTDPNGTGIYEVLLNNMELEIGNLYEFKFRTNNSWSGIYDTMAFNRKIIISDSTHEYYACMNDQCIGSDLALISINNPVSGCNMYSQQNVAITYANTGADTLYGPIEFSYYTDLGGWVKDTVALAPIPPYYRSEHVFSYPMETITYGKYNLTVAINFTGDSWVNNDTLRTSIYNQPSQSIPYFENFEGTDYWMVGGKNPSWERGYPSNFAAEMPASGSNCWVTSLAGNSNSNEESYLTSPCYFVSAVQALGVRFKYAMNTSVNSGALLEYFNTMDSTWLECSDFSMPAEFNQPMENVPNSTAYYWKGRVNQWKTAVFKITNPPSDLKLRIKYVNTSTEASRGFAIDDLEIFDWYKQNLSILETYPKSAPVLEQTPGIRVKNYGLNPFTGNIIWHGVYDVMTSSDTTYVSLNPFDETTLYSLTTQDFDSQISINGAIYNLDYTHYTDFADSMIVNINNLENVSTYPWFEDFEINPENRWYAHNDKVGDDPVWRVGVPQGVHLFSTYLGSNSLTTIGQKPMPSNVYAFAESPAFDMSVLLKPVVSFYIKRHLTDEGNKVALLVKEGLNAWYSPAVINDLNWMKPTNFINYGMINGYSQVVDNDWVFVTAALPDLAGKADVQFKFVVETGYNWTGDEGVSIDNFKVSESANTDLALGKLVNPVLRPSLSNEAISIEVINQGILTVDSASYALSYSVNGGAFVVDSSGSAILLGDTLLFTFASSYDFSALGKYNVRVAVSIPGDTISFNDSADFIFINQPIISTFPYQNTFEGTLNWFSPSDVILWQIGSPNGNHINSSYSGVNAIYTELSTQTAPVLGVIESPWFNFSGITNPSAAFRIWKDVGNTFPAAAMLQATVDSCKTWFTFGSTGYEWYNNSSDILTTEFVDPSCWAGIDTAWQHTYSIYHYGQAIAGMNAVKFRLVFKANQLNDTLYNGFAFDDFMVYNSEYDLAMNNIFIPVNWAPGANENIQFEVKNSGKNDVTYFEVDYSIDGQAWVTDTIFGTVFQGGNTNIFTSNSTFDLSAFGLHTIKMAVSVPGDGNPFNDTLEVQFNKQLREGLTDTFSDSSLANWSGSSYYFLSEGFGEMTVNAAGKIGWENLYFNVNPLSITNNPYLSVRLKTDVAVNVRFLYADIYDTYSDSAFFGFNLIPDGVYHTYYVDYTNKLKNVNGVQLDPGSINNVVVQFNFGYDFTGVVYMDDLRLGADAAINSNLSVVKIDAGNRCNNNPGNPVMVQFLNMGIDTLSNIELSLMIDSVPIVTDIYMAQVNPGDTATHTFSSLIDFSNTEYNRIFNIDVDLYHPSDEIETDNYKNLKYGVFGTYTDKPGWVSNNTCTGLADNNVWALGKDLNGDIWMSGFYGVTRFDGTNFTQYHASDGLIADYIWNMEVASDGTVWLPSTKGGFNSYKDGVFTSYFPFDSLIFDECSFEDTLGKLWFGSYVGNGVAVFDGTSWFQYADQAGTVIEDIDYAPNGNLLFANTIGVVQFDGSTFSAFEFDTLVRSVKYVNEVFRDSRNVTWFYGSNVLTSYDGTLFTDYSVEVEPIGSVQAIEEDVNGNVWFGGATGAASFNGSIWKIITSTDGLIPSSIWSIIGTDNGDVWFGTRQGASWLKVGPKAEFIYSLNGIEASFTDLSQGGIASYLYTFGDGDSAFVANPVHTFVPGSSYDVCLTVTDTASNVDTYCFMISVETILCEAHFNYSINQNEVTFTDSSSTNITSYLWNFGDGDTSVDMNPIHVYQNIGTYTVSLTVTDSTGYCSNSISKEVAITELSSAKVVLQVDMSYQISSGLFDPMVDYVDAVGSFDGWTGTMMFDTNSDSIYEVTLGGFAIGDTIEYRFRYNGDWCQPYEFIYSGQTRKYGIANFVDTVFHIFNDQPYEPVYRSFDISLDMSRITYLGGFNPATDYIKASGGIICWTDPVLADPDSNLIYTIHLDSLYADLNDTLEIQFAINDIIFETVGLRLVPYTSINNTAQYIWSNETEPIADFEYTIDSLTVSFADNSYGAVVSYQYKFGDGNISSIPNPVYTYSKGGIYDVCLNITDTSGITNNICKQIMVGDSTQTGCYAMFSYIVSGDSVSFVNESSATVSNNFWDFGDNTYSTLKSPIHEYAAAGYYLVTLTVTDTINSCTDVYETSVLIEGTGDLCLADFVFETSSQEVTFINTSNGIVTDYLWSFGDGTYSTDTSPVHLFQLGVYEVCLTIYNAANDCMDDVCQTVVVKDSTSVVCISDFSFTVDQATVSFFAQPTGNITNYLWDFGDNQFSEEQDPVQTYLKPNFYKVKLTVFDSIGNCLNSKTKTVVVKVGGETLCNASFTSFVKDNEVVFTNTSSGNASEIFWSFGDGTYSSDSAPKHIYAYPDFYEVCLSIYDSISGCMDEYCDVVAVTSSGAFICNADFDYFTQGKRVTFQPMVTGTVTNYFWDFGDGYFTKDVAPIHTYEKPGYFPVSLKVYNDTTQCMDEKMEFIIVIDSSYMACKAQFTWHANNRKVAFVNQSQGEYTSLFWNMGDGSYFSDSSFTYSYSRSGYYWVEMTMFNELTGCLDTYADWVVAIDSNQYACQASFGYYANGKVVEFSNQSAGEITDYFWDFGDGTYSIDSTAEHTYNDPGFYEVILTVFNATSYCLNQYSAVIKVIDNSTELCQAQFTYYPEGNSVTYTSQAVGAFKQLFWDFGDGTNSNQASPVHVYAKPGYYQVMHTVIDTTSSCFDTKFKVVYVAGTTQPASGVVSANFNHYPASDSLKVYFSDLSLGNVTQWYWNFGDNTEASLLQNPEHIYVENDYYRVCQTVSNPESQNTLCKFIPVGDVSTKNTAFFTYFADSVTATAYFQNKSLGDIVSYFWDFGDGNTSEQKSPSHTYADTGYYAVCLSTISSVGRVRTYCADIRIGNSIDNPCLYSCVWPGDANSDLEANHYDLLTIGLNYGMEGPRREDASIKWYGQFAQNWSTFQLDGTNNKHGDCNGDGIIDILDTLAINQNFAYSHYWNPDVKAADWEIICQWDANEKAEGSRRKAKAILSPPFKKAPGEIYGIGYEIKVMNGQGIYWDSVYVTFDGSWMGTPGEELMTFYTLDPENYIIYVASVRNDHQNVSGEGMVATISMAFKEGFSSSDISFNVTTLGGIEATGITVQIGGSILLNLGPDITVCEGETVTLVAPEGFENYTWNTGSNETSIEATTAGKYYLQVSDSLGAAATDTIEVIWVPVPVVDLAPEINAQDSVELDAGEGFASYEWSTGATTRKLMVKTSGTYWVVVSNEQGCFGYDTVDVTITGIRDGYPLASQVNIYPNPNTGSFWIIFDGTGQGTFRFELTDVKGTLLANDKWTADSRFRRLVKPDYLPQGVYYLKCYLNETVTIKKVIVQ
ncbi:MAG TPA: hypothetical protein DCY97_14875 [Marinilabiliales bacterium]|nr:hypothetical protein [Marinilabiliales bacterium]